MSYKFNLAPKALDEQSAGFKKLHPTLDSLAGNDAYLMQAKYDGCLAIINTVDDQIITRTGEVVTSMPHILAAARRLFPGMVLFGEAYKWDTPFKDISGMFRRHAPQEDLIVVLQDCVPYKDWMAGVCNKPYIERLGFLEERLGGSPCPFMIVAPSHDLVAPQAFANELVRVGGYDGAIIRRKDAAWTAGASKDGAAIKVKPVQSLDLRAVDWFYGKGKHEGRAGGIVVEYKGVRTEVGTGFSDRERETIAGQGTRGWIAEIEFMEITDAGKLREPRFKGWRHDKVQPD